jgi:hypothetical protein
MFRCTGLVWMLAGLWTLSLGGCSSSAGPVQGRVTMDDKPVDSATVSFVEEKTKRSSSGFTDPEGNFTLATLKPGDGVPPGTYKVTVTKSATKVAASSDTSSPTVPIIPDPKAKPGEGAGEDRNKNILPALYQDVQTTPFKFDVPAGGLKGVEIKLDSKATAK